MVNFYGVVIDNSKVFYMFKDVFVVMVFVEEFFIMVSVGFVGSIFYMIFVFIIVIICIFYEFCEIVSEVIMFDLV